MALGALSASPGLRASAPDAERMQAALNQALLGLPFLRAIAVADVHGNVVTSTNGSEAGIRINMDQLGPRGPVGSSSIGPLIMGR
eukprot:gene45324-56452_t